MKSSCNLMKESISYIVRSIATKVIIVILILIFPLNVFTIVLSEMALNNIINQTKLSVSNVVQNYLTDIEDRMKHMAILLYSLRVNHTDGIIVGKQKADHKYYQAKNRFYGNVRSSMALTKTADGAFMYMNQIDDIIIWNMDSHIHSTNDMLEFLLQLVNEGSPKGWRFYMLPNKKGDEYPVLCLFAANQGVYSGEWIELSNIGDKLKKDLQYEQVEVLFTEEKVAAADKNEMVVSTYFKKAKMYITIKLDNKEINGGILLIYLLMRKIAITALILLPFLYYLLYRLLLQPLWKINQAHRAIEAGNPNYRIDERAGSVEYEMVYESFNRMADSLKSLKIENYEKELERQRIELKNLQLQIRPHFLMNAFNLIFNLAQERDVEHIQDIMLYLSNYFRHIFRSDRELELFGIEQKLIEGYVNMAQIRYPSSIVVEYDYDPEISYVRLPLLLIHNFVENIIKHVVKQGVITHIYLEGRYESGMVTFQIIDDGPGLSNEQLRTIDHRMRRGEISGTNVGMANSYRRLKYYYGEEADIEILSEIGRGTTIVVRFPYNLEE